MIRATSLRGRAVVSLESAERIGTVEDVILDPEHCHIGGLLVARSEELLGRNRRAYLPPAAIHAVGATAVTVRSSIGARATTGPLVTLPRLSGMTGRLVVSHGGVLFGVIGDVLLDGEDGHIIGYALEDALPAGWLRRRRHAGQAPPPPFYVRADTDIRVGPELVVVPDAAVVRGEAPAPEPPAVRTVCWSTPGPPVPRPAARPIALERTPAPPARRAPTPLRARKRSPRPSEAPPPPLPPGDMGHASP